MSPDTITVGVVRTPEELAAVQRFRYRLLHRSPRPSDLPLLDHETGRHRDPLDDRLLVIHARSGDTVIGTFRWGVADWCVGSDPYPDRVRAHRRFFDDCPGSRIGRSDRMVIEPGGPGRHAMYRVIAIGIRIAVASGCRYDLCWCAPELVRLYARLGYDPIDIPMHTEDGRPIVAMRLDLVDLEKLIRRRSPLARAVRSPRAA